MDCAVSMRAISLSIPEKEVIKKDRKIIDNLYESTDEFQHYSERYRCR